MDTIQTPSGIPAIAPYPATHTGTPGSSVVPYSLVIAPPTAAAPATATALAEPGGCLDCAGSSAAAAPGVTQYVPGAAQPASIVYVQTYAIPWPLIAALLAVVVLSKR